MKKSLLAFMIVAAVLAGQTFAQHGSGKGHNKPARDDAGKAKAQTEVKQQEKGKPDQPGTKAKEKENQGQGNAYGKNKGDLQGKEFGQARAADAKTKKEAVENSEANVNNADKANNETRTKIKEAREKLDNKKKSKQITDAEYKQKKQAIDNLEKELNAVENEKNDVKGQLEREKAVKK